MSSGYSLFTKSVSLTILRHWVPFARQNKQAPPRDDTTETSRKGMQHTNDDGLVSVFRSPDHSGPSYGETWKSIRGNLQVDTSTS